MIHTSITRPVMPGFFRSVSHSFQQVWKALQIFSLKRTSQKTILIPKFVRDTSNDSDNDNDDEKW